jgi:uncharacterized protein YutD
MEGHNKYIRKWQELVIEMNEAIQKNDFIRSEDLLKESTDMYNRYKEVVGYASSNRKKTFGELNYMLESELPRLFKTNKTALKECTKLIKEDNNLRSSFMFIDSLRKYNCDGDASSYVNETINLASNGVDRKTFKESIQKLADILSKYEIGGYQIDEDTIKYFKSCDKVLTEKKKLSNLTDYTNAINCISSYIEKHKSPVKESKKGIEEITEELENKLSSLNEDEQTLVRDIIDSKTPMVEQKQEQLFNRFKDECLEMVSRLIDESDSDSIDGLNAIKEQIENKTYSKDTIIQDIAKLLEVRDILNEK